MSTARRYILATGLALICSTPSFAQEATIEHSQTERTTRIEGHVEKTYIMKFELTPPEQRRCKLRVSLDYLQKNAVADVKSVLENEDCEASSGNYTVAIRFRDEKNELQNREYEETWQRDDKLPIEINREYFIGDNVDLLNVRARNLRCLCADAPPETKEERQ